MANSVVNSIISIAILAITTNGLTDAKNANNNDIWRPNNDIFRLMDPFYYKLALHTSDRSDQRKRFVSIVSLSMSIYMRSNVTEDDQREQDAVSKTRRHLDKPADAIAGPMRAILTVLRAIIDKPINDVKESCPPEVDQASCKARLHERHERNEAACPGYMRNVRYHDRIVKLIHSKHVSDITYHLERTRSISDEDAVNYFIKIATGRHSELLKEMRDVYQSQLHVSYNCNVLNVPF